MQLNQQEKIMKVVLPVLFVVVVVISIFHSTTQPSIEGCYSKSEEITSLAYEESEIKQSYLNLSKSSNNVLVEGLIWGTNFHICSVGSPSEDSDGPLSMKLSGDKLLYRYSEPEYGIDCELEVVIQGNKLLVNDSNNHCSEYVFYCGVHASLDGLELTKQSEGCHNDK